MPNHKRQNDRLMEDRSGRPTLMGSETTKFNVSVPTALVEAFKAEFADEAGRYGYALEKAMIEYLKAHAGYRFYRIRGED